MWKRVPTAYAVIVVVLLFCPRTMAQNTSTDHNQTPAESKADEPPSATAQASNQPPLVTKVRAYIENNPIIEKMKGDGFYPRIGGLSQGSGLAGGGGYRRHFDWAFIDVSGAISTKAYRGIDVTAGWIETKRLELATKLTYRNNTQDDFYGLGMDTTDAMRVDYGIHTTDITARAAANLARGLVVGADVGYYIPSVRHGRDKNLQTIATLFNDATAPGLAQQPDFVHESVFVEIDSRDVHGFPRRGGFYRASYALWNDRTLEQYNFRRFDAVGAHFVSLTDRDVVALRLGLTYANNAPGDRIPFFLLPYVGGGDTVRSFREFRFRDENAGVFNTELRHKVHSMIYVAGFMDFGKVAHDWEDINPHDMKRAWGVGVRAGTDDRTYVRFDTAWGDDGTRVFVKFTPSF